MKVAHIVYGLTFGGIETMLVNIANEQAALGHDIHVIVINDLVEPTLRDRLAGAVHFHAIGRKVGSRNPWPVAKLNLLLLRLNPDTIHLHTDSIARYLSPHFKPRTCVTQHNVCTDTDSIYLHLTPTIFAISQKVRDDIRQKRGLGSVVVYNGIATSKFKQNASREHHSGPFRIVQTGRLAAEHKGQDILLRAIAILKSDGITGITASFIGDGPSLESLQTLAKELGIRGQVEFLGSRPQEYIYGHLCDYDLFVQPSRYEGFGLTVAEAMAAGVPVLVSDIDGPMEIIAGGLYGSHFRSEDPADCAARIKEIYRSQPDPAKTAAALDHVRRHFEVSNTAKKYLNLYPRKK